MLNWPCRAEEGASQHASVYSHIFGRMADGQHGHHMYALHSMCVSKYTSRVAITLAQRHGAALHEAFDFGPVVDAGAGAGAGQKGSGRRSTQPALASRLRTDGPFDGERRGRS